MKTAVVLLNYNDAEATIAAVRRIESFSSVNSIIVLDNASKDDSLKRLVQEFAAGNKENAAGKNNRIYLLKNKKNGGYGYGNNRGVSFAKKHCGAELVLIANPDAFFDETLVKVMKKAFEEDSLTGAAGAVMEGFGGYEDYLRSGWCERDFKHELMASAPVLKRLFRDKINYSEKYYNFNAPVIPVYAVHGSLVMVRADAFLSCGGYDEEMFLYMEEYALAARLKKSGYKTVLLSQSYKHEGSHSISGDGNNAVKRQRFRQASELIYYRKYLGACKPGLLLARLLQKIILLETYLFVR